MGLWEDLPFISEWDADANGELAEFAGPLSSRVQWRCQKDSRHTWQAQISARKNNGSGCPVCLNQKIVPGINDLFTTDPEIAAALDEEMSGFSARQISRGNRKKTGYWSCPNHPDFKAFTTAHQLIGRGCPVCSGRQIVSGFNDLKTLRPDLFEEWHPTRNQGLDPAKLAAGTGKQIWWLCKKDNSHEWQATGDRRVTRGSGCPYCLKQRVMVGQTDLMSKDPDLAKFWDHAKNQLAPSEVYYGSSAKRYWWHCVEGNDHSFLASIPMLVKKPKCLVCNNRQFQLGVNDLKTKNPLLAAEWHPTKNSGLESSQVSATSDEKYWWLCSKDFRHEWQAPVRPRHTRGIGCPICGNDWVLPGVNDLASTRPDLLERWAYDLNLDMSPLEVTRRSKKKVWWRCLSDSRHVWKATIYALDDGKGCLYCTGQLVQTGVNDLATRFPDIAAQWNYQRNENVLPGNVFARSRRSFWWRCSEHFDHEWKSSVSNRTRFTSGGCPFCSGKSLKTGFNDLATVRSDLAALWSFEKNELDPSLVLAGTHAKYWWQCPNDSQHSWYAPVVSLALGTRCPSCQGQGFDQTQEAILYFIFHPGLLAKKIGITNSNNEVSRVQMFQKAGWKIIHIQGPLPGTQILNLETKLLRWIRLEVGLPPFLDSSQMKATAGWSETFSAEGLTNNEVLNKIGELLDSELCAPDL